MSQFCAVDRRVGSVESLTFESRADRSDALVVRTGFLRRKTVLIAITDVIEIRPREERIVVRASSTVYAARSSHPRQKVV